MKKIWYTAAMALTLAAALSACGKGGQASGTTAAQAESTAEETKVAENMTVTGILAGNGKSTISLIAADGSLMTFEKAEDIDASGLKESGEHGTAVDVTYSVDGSREGGVSIASKIADAAQKPAADNTDALAAAAEAIEAVNDKDPETFASYLGYPLTVVEKGESKTYEDEDAFLAAYPEEKLLDLAGVQAMLGSDLMNAKISDEQKLFVGGDHTGVSFSEDDAAWTITEIDN